MNVLRVLLALSAIVFHCGRDCVLVANGLMRAFFDIRPPEASCWVQGPRCTKSIDDA